MAYDVARIEANWGPPTFQQPSGPNKFPLTVTRRTSDGKLQYKQLFQWNTDEKDVLITVELRNVSSQTVNVSGIIRYVDQDVDNNFTNFFDKTADSVSARNVNGLMLTQLTQNPVTALLNAFAPSAQCNQPVAATPPATGDYASAVSINGASLAPNAAMTIKYLYRRY